MFDIDGTLVYDGTWNKPIHSVINFCNYCKEIGITTIIITARPGWESNIANTKNSLQELGIACDAFFFRKPDCHDLDNFKTTCRKYIDNIAKSSHKKQQSFKHMEYAGVDHLNLFGFPKNEIWKDNIF